MNFAVPVDHREKIKESKKRDKYLDFARKKNKLWNTKVTAITTVIGAPEKIPEILVKRLDNLEIRRHVETIWTTVLLR